ncbi:MAG: redoxin domain-containing protein [Akkermansia sp.]|nr:redoxin domain-containing protein [Akkermansia sp.]
MKYLLYLLTFAALLGTATLPATYASSNDIAETEEELAAVPLSLQSRRYVTKARPKLDAKVYFIYQSRYMCPRCVAEAPAIAATYKKMKGKGAELVMLNIDQDDKTAATWAKKAKLRFPIVSPTDRAGIPFPYNGPNALPCMVAVDVYGNKLGEAGGTEVADFLAKNWKKFVKEIKKEEKEEARDKDKD